MPGLSIACMSLQWGHVYADVETTLAARAIESIHVLQWGHVYADVETVLGTAMKYTQVALQWGHVYADVETGSRNRVRGGLGIASMGPRLCRRGNIKRKFRYVDKQHTEMYAQNYEQSFLS